jgi:hypothetical protein
VKTAEHILLCPEEGRVEAFWLATSALEQWLDAADTFPFMDSSNIYNNAIFYGYLREN